MQPSPRNYSTVIKAVLMAMAGPTKKQNRRVQILSRIILNHRQAVETTERTSSISNTILKPSGIRSAHVEYMAINIVSKKLQQ
jgi:hypothetical protein